MHLLCRRRSAPKGDNVAVVEKLLNPLFIDGSLKLRKRGIIGEAAVALRIGEALGDPFSLVPDLALLAPPLVAAALARAAQLAGRVAGRMTDGVAEWIADGDHELLRTLVDQVQLLEQAIVIRLSVPDLAAALGIDGAITAVIELQGDATRKRCGGAVRLVQSNGRAVTARKPDAKLVRLIVKGQLWWQRLVDERILVTQLADAEAVGAAYVTRVMRLAFLAPDIVDQIATGTAPPWLDGGKLLATGAIACDWNVQRETLAYPQGPLRPRNNVAYESHSSGLVSDSKQSMPS